MISFLFIFYMILSEALVFLVVHLKWSSILLMNANEEVSTSVVMELNSKGVSISSVGVNKMEDYLWPERYNIRPPFNGHLLILDKFGSSFQHISRIVQFLKSKNIFHTQHPWIIGVDGYLCLPRILKLFDENDQIIVIGNYLRSDSNCSRMGTNNRHYQANISTCSLKPALSVWVLQSFGNGSVTFESRGYMGCNISSEAVQTFYEKPFKNFRGRTVKISSLGSPPIRIPPRKGETLWRGYMFEIINTLAEIFNFSYVVKEANNRLYGMKQKDGSWTGMIGELTRKSVDMGVGDLSWTMERSMAVDFTLPVFPETNTFIYRSPAFYSRTWILFEDIDFMIWISLAISFIIGWTTFFFTLSLPVLKKSRRRKNYKNQDKKYISNASKSIGILYRGLLGQGIPRTPNLFSSRVMLGTWVIAALILSALYSGGLTSKLSLHKSPRPANTLRELLKRYPNALLAVRNNSQIHSFFKEAPYWREVYLLNMEKNVIPGKITIHDTMKRVHNMKESPPYVWIAERSMLVKMMYRYSDDPHVCDLYVAMEAIERADWSLALVRNSPFLTQFNEMIKRMQRFGLLEKWRRENWESGRGTCNPSDGLNRSLRTAMSFNDTQAIFIVLALSWIVGGAILLVERRVHFKAKRSRT